MQICLDACVQTAGGGSTFISNFLQQLRLVPHNHEFTVISTEHQPFRLDGCRSIVLPRYSRVRQLLWSQYDLRRLLVRQGFDIYHSLKLIGPVFKPTRTIYRLAAVGQFCGIYPQPRSELFYWKYLGGLSYRRADLVIAVSEYIRRGAIEFMGLREDQVITVHNGVSPIFRRLSQDEIDQAYLKSCGIAGPYILCAGNLVPVKNFSTAIRAFHSAERHRQPEQTLVFAGSPVQPEANALKNLVAELGLTKRVLFLGYQTPAQMLHLYNGATVMLHPSLHEGMSFSIVEAMACGLPLILSKTTSLPETAGDAAVYVEQPTDVEGFAHQLRQVLEDSQLRERLSTAGLQQAAHYSWRRCIEGNLRAYEMLRSA